MKNKKIFWLLCLLFAALLLGAAQMLDHMGMPEQGERLRQASRNPASRAEARPPSMSAGGWSTALAGARRLALAKTAKAVSAMASGACASQSKSAGRCTW